ncbi:MAG: hypothetical protein ACLT4H_21320 [Bacteroides thetaiotaomicron]|uniref:Uncharacterized protein n=1 Tax=Bacteroides thetaiotaomicron TaxID=818 RepID=A0A174RDR0_BACT4|nr:hypothetical protein [Bacteroides thetaiotaomicron]CUP82166.1 Uncharacterised protein [Bacteroides thetaiotaomicron]
MKYTYYIERAAISELDGELQTSTFYMASNYQYEKEYHINSESINDANPVVKEICERISCHSETQIRVLKVQVNLFDYNKVLSNDLYIIYKLFARVLELYNSDDLKELQRTRRILRDSMSDSMRLKYYYMIDAAKKLYKTDKIKHILFCLSVVEEIEDTIGQDAISNYDNLYPICKTDKQHMLAISALERFNVSMNVMGIIEGLLRFSSYRGDITLRDFFDRIKVDINFLLESKGYKLSKKKSPNNTFLVMNKEEVLRELSPYIHHKRINEILLKIDEELGLTINRRDKLEQTTIFLLLYKRCNLFNKMVFSKFKRLLTQYYGIEDNSYKENDCTNGRNPKCSGNCDNDIAERLCKGKCAEIYCGNPSLFKNALKKNN